MLNAVECLRSLLIHLLREAEVGYADDIVAANLRCVRLQLLVRKVHLTQGLEDADVYKRQVINTEKLPIVREGSRLAM